MDYSLIVGTSIYSDLDEGQLLIDQGVFANDKAIAMWSDVAHGMTDFGDTDQFGFLEELDSTNGGLVVAGLGKDKTGD